MQKAQIATPKVRLPREILSLPLRKGETVRLCMRCVGTATERWRIHPSRHRHQDRAQSNRTQRSMSIKASWTHRAATIRFRDGHRQLDLLQRACSLRQIPSTCRQYELYTGPGAKAESGLWSAKSTSPCRERCQETCLFTRKQGDPGLGNPAALCGWCAAAPHRAMRPTHLSCCVLRHRRQTQCCGPQHHPPTRTQRFQLLR